ncbi:lantibiotic dehydratase [Daejeonella sp. JGW-45]|uniref:lantibiotic dehydratase n=1 Tax=Daejeonella sp. JGW-45 TaxID=3034148 RepID=UPI0023ED7752|nr:lantibiotic dehydratase [Daejeonella sp. JGW-45]
MKVYDLYPRMVLRIPRFPVNKAAEPLDEMLKNPVFRDALFLASDVLDGELNRNDFQLRNCSKKMKHTLMKYHKRICYRPTPFGAFAGIAIFPWNETKDPEIVVSEDAFETLVIKKSLTDHHSGILFEENHYRVNPFLYPYGTDYRVLKKDEKDRGNTFSIAEIFASDVIRNLADCKHTISRESLLDLLHNSSIDKNELDWYVNELIALQIIMPHKYPCRSFPYPLMPEHKELPGSSYDSYCRVSVTGSHPVGLNRQLQDAVHCLEKLSSRYEPKALTHFKDRFRKLFDRKEVPLLQALDPEMGVDYAGLSNDLLIEKQTKMPERITWTPMHELLLSKWTMQSGYGIPEIELIDQDLSKLNVTHKTYPPGASVVFSVIGDKVFIRAAGGVSGLNMIGRFTVLDPGILDLAKDIAQIEMKHNPDVLFAEISHLDSANLASVKSKAMVYDYQIPFFDHPEVPDDFVIKLNDLYISIVDDCLHLRSARLNKRIIPRFSSAYNYHNSSLPIFRFLCDLQYEGTDPILNFSMTDLFPGLPAYPRIRYKNIILEAATWYLDAKPLVELKSLDSHSQIRGFRSIAVEIGLPEEFCYVMHDHLLYIKLSCEKDVLLLLQEVPFSGKIILKEYYKDQETLVNDKKGNSYTHEWIAFMMNREKSYSSHIHRPGLLPWGITKKDKLFPFDEWLYFKIYLHPAGYTDLLVNYIHPFVSENFRQGNISSWFFISYCDQNFHLRVRLKQMPGREIMVLKTYKILEQNFRELPNLKRIELSTYIPEMERYAVIGIQRAEELFELSSEIVLSSLRQFKLSHYSVRDKLFVAIKHVFMGCLSIGLDYHKIEEVSKSISCHLTKSQKVEFDLEFREHKKDLWALMLETEKGIVEKKYMIRLRTVAESLEPDEKLHLMTDLNHMHLNRHYLHDQPFFEVKTYYFLFKMTRMLISYQTPFYDLKKKFCSLS